MTSRRSYQPRKCIPVLNDLKEERFSDETLFDDEKNVDCSIFTTIWKNPERVIRRLCYSNNTTTL
ncbi:hypothetical protein CRE_03944 [Caenorhabditis remanei]|uniref:Uncharacterized protein n=1 Tax=Caenorhabditis remanei TaxID=31234 RepID=E3LY00_CAERE|nr:hypothetical protein CRE_03944 [Caenorhabditis remanei]